MEMIKSTPHRKGSSLGSPSPTGRGAFQRWGLQCPIHLCYPPPNSGPYRCWVLIRRLWLRGHGVIAWIPCTRLTDGCARVIVLGAQSSRCASGSQAPPQGPETQCLRFQASWKSATKWLQNQWVDFEDIFITLIF